jgi:hypothetical protein
MLVCGAYIPQGLLPSSLGGRLASPGIATHVIGDASRRCRGQAPPGGAASGRACCLSRLRG